MSDSTSIRLGAEGPKAEPGKAPAQAFEGYWDLTRDNVTKYRNWYRRRARWVRYFFRGSGVVVILLSVSLPLVATADFADKDLVISVIGVVIAGLTAIRNFYQWDHVWRIVRVADFELTFVLADWELELAKLAEKDDPEEASRLAFEKTKALFADTQAIMKNEAKQYFGTLTWPDIATRGDK